MTNQTTTDATQAWLNTVPIGGRLSLTDGAKLGAELSSAQRSGLISFQFEGRSIGGAEATLRRWINVNIVRVK